MTNHRVIKTYPGENTKRVLNKDVLIFGTNDTAQLAYYYISSHSDYNVIGFVVDEDHKKVDTFCGLTVFILEGIESFFSPDDVWMFVPMTGKNMNRDRCDIYWEIGELGYSFISYVSPFATVLSENIGENCFILENNTIQPFVTIQNNVILWSGNHIGHHSAIRNHVFFTSHVVLSGNCEVDHYCWFGVNSTITNACKVASGTLLGMGSTLTLPYTTRDTMYLGSPAKDCGPSQGKI